MTTPTENERITDDVYVQHIFFAIDMSQSKGWLADVEEEIKTAIVEALNAKDAIIQEKEKEIVRLREKVKFYEHTLKLAREEIKKLEKALTAIKNSPGGGPSKRIARQALEERKQ